MTGYVWTCALLMGVQMHWAKGEKILLIPSPSYSLCTSLVSIGEELILKGHEVVVYQAKDFDTRCPGNNGMRTIIYRSPEDLEAKMAAYQETMGRVSKAKAWEKTFLTTLLTSGYQENVCRYSLGDSEAMQKVADEQFDFMLVDGSIYNACYSVIPYKLNVRYGVYGGIMFTWPGLRSLRPHTDPTYFSPVSGDMSVTEIALNTAAMIYQYVAFTYNLPINYVNKIAPELSRKQTIDLLFTGEVYLVNDYTFLGYPDARSSKVIEVGGLLAKPAQSLPADIQQFLDQASDKVVIFTFGGSSFSDIPDEFLKKFADALSKLDNPIIWKHNSNKTEGNIMTKPWLPVNDILAHPNVGVAVQHCGRNGFFEAVYHGVPVICLPVMFHQPHFGARVEKLGIGKTLELGSFTSNQLREAIMQVLINPIYKSNVVKVSKIFHSFPETSAQKAAFWTDHVIKHGGDHLHISYDSNMVYLELLFVGQALFVVALLLYRFCCGLFVKICSALS